MNFSENHRAIARRNGLKSRGKPAQDRRSAEERFLDRKAKKPLDIEKILKQTFKD